MMQRAAIILLAGLLLGAPGHKVQAGMAEFFHRMHVDWHRMNCYPEPFIHADRAAVKAPFAVMINNGWRAQNTLGHHHFDPETHQLTAAGVIKLRWILTAAPVDHRTVFVLRGTRANITEIRLDSVQQSTAMIVAKGPLPEIFQTGVEPPAWSAAYIDAIHRSRASSIPTPRLREAGE